MVSKNNVVVELFGDHPNREDWVLEVLADLDVLQGLEDCQEAELWFVGDTVESEVFLQVFCAVETVGWRLTGDKEVHKLLCAMSMVTD